MTLVETERSKLDWKFWICSGTGFIVVDYGGITWDTVWVHERGREYFMNNYGKIVR